MAEEVTKVKNITSRNELLTFLQLFKEHIEIYNQKLIELRWKYKYSEKVILYYFCQLMGAFQGFTITSNWHKFVENQKWINCLFSPSPSHYLINPEKTILMLTRTNLGSGEVSNILESLKSRTEKAYPLIESEYGLLRTNNF